MQIAELMRWGYRQIMASELNAPIDAPATTIRQPPAESLWIAGMISSATVWWKRLNKASR